MSPSSYGDTVHRRRPLPVAPGRGRILIPTAVAAGTLGALRGFRGDDGPHEGIVLWAGRVVDEDVIVASAIVPDAEHTWGSVRIGHEAVSVASRAARAVGLVIVAQVHSHPKTDTRHSDGDDTMILLPHEGMFSLVVSEYGMGTLTPGEGVGVHQFQDGRWVAVASQGLPVVLVPPVIRP